MWLTQAVNLRGEEGTRLTTALFFSPNRPHTKFISKRSDRISGTNHQPTQSRIPVNRVCPGNPRCLTKRKKVLTIYFPFSRISDTSPSLDPIPQVNSSTVVEFCMSDLVLFACGCCSLHSSSTPPSGQFTHGIMIERRESFRAITLMRV